MRASSSPIRKTVKKEVAVQNAGNFTFKIPPDEANYKVESEYRLPQNALLLSVSPHMHVRGKDFRYDLIYPGRQDGDAAVGAAVRLRLADDATSWPSPSSCRGHEHALHGPLRQLGGQPGQSRPHGRGRLGRANLGRNDVRLVRHGAGRPGPDQTGQRPALRVKEFLAQAAADGVQLDDQIKILARKALESDKTFELLSYQLFDLVPQLDRVCVTGVEGDKPAAENAARTAGAEDLLPQHFNA